jgi:hypothetical protein
MRLIVTFIFDILIIGLFLYSKLLPYKDKLTGRYLSIFNFFEKLFVPILQFFKSFAKPAQVGTGLAVDMSQIILLILFLIVINSM